MKKLSKRLSLFVCLTIIANLLVFSAPIVSASNDESEVLYKSGFADYTKNGSPKGWQKTNYVVSGQSEVENTTSYAYAESETGGHNNILKMDATPGSVVNDVVPFGKVISDGKLHISFDHKIPVESYTGKQSSLMLVLFNMNNPQKYRDTDVTFNDYDPYNLYDFRGTVGHQQSHLVRIPYYNGGDTADNSIKVSTSGLYWTPDVATGNVVDCNKWYHYDVVVDIDNNVYDLWLDGKKITDATNNTQGKLRSDSGYNQFKGFAFLQQDGNLKKGLYDNLTITHYTTNDKIQMVADAGKDGIGTSAADGKYLNVSFNDTLKYDLRDNDFIITAADGSAVSGVVVTNATKSGCVLDFSAANGLKANTNYIVTYNNSNTGVATEVDAHGASAEFRTNAAAVDTSSNGYKYYYSKEDFNGFTDRMQLPFGFYNPSNMYYFNANENYASNTNSYNKYLSKAAESAYSKYLPVDGKDGKAMKLINSSYIYHFFPRGVVAGDFTMEFDINYKVGGWSIGLIPYRNWENASVQNKLSRINNNRYINALVGMSTAGTDENISAPNLAICKTEISGGTQHAQPTMGESYNMGTGLTVRSDEWAHLKLDFDMAEGNVDITVTDSNGEKKIENLSYGDWNKFGSGVEGIVFYKGNSSDKSAEVSFDNLEVYTTSGKLLNQDFEGYTVKGKTRFPYFWISDVLLKNPNPFSDSRDVSSVGLTYTNNAYAAEGKSANGDNALKLTGTKANSGNTGEPLWYTTRFEKTVPAGQSYAVEFDLKYEDDNTVWVYGPVDSTRVTSLKGYNDLGYVSSAFTDEMLTNTNLIAMANKNLYWYKHTRQMPIDADSDIINPTSTFFNAITSDDSQVKDAWNHYKIIAVPQANNTKYIVTVNDGAEYTFTDNLKNNTKDIAGIAFQIRNKTNYSSTWGIILDNVNAYLCDETGKEITDARENSILDIEAEKLNGDTVSLMNTNEIPYSTKKITVTFSENLDETLKKDITAVNVDNASRTYNKDTKEVVVTKPTDYREAAVKGIYDCVEDVIQLRINDAAYPMDYTSEIDGNKFIITLNDVLSSDTTYSLHIAKNVSFASSPYSTLDKGFSRTYTGVTDPDGGFKLTSCKAVVKSGDSWKEVTSFADITSGEANLGLKFNVTNVTGAAKNIRAVAAFYDESGELAELVNVGIFDQVIESEADAQTPILEIAMPTLSEGKSYTTIKFFAWDADSSAPLKRPQIFTNVTE